MLPDRIYLVGMPGCGKSTEGKKLAKSLKWEFCDLDHLIEQISGKTISGYFEQFGETQFRILERAALVQTSKMEKVVVSCGGGTPVFSNNMELINSYGLSIYLNCSEGFLLNRLLKSTRNRPLFRDLNPSELKEKILELSEKRLTYYLKAKIQINLPNEQGKVFIDKVLSLLNSM